MKKFSITENADGSLTILVVAFGRKITFNIENDGEWTYSDDKS